MLYMNPALFCGRRGERPTPFIAVTNSGIAKQSHFGADALPAGDRVRPFGAPGTRKVKEILIDRVDGAMVEAIHRLGHVLGLKSIAEWVENAEILEKLNGMKVDYVQGFHLAVPRPI